MGNGDFDTKIKIEKFAEELEIELREMRRFVKFLNTDKKFNKELKQALSLLDDKLESIKKSKSIKDASSVLKIKKLNKEFGDKYV